MMAYDEAQEVLTLYSSAGQSICDVSVPLFRPRMDVLTLRGRTFVWRDEFEQYRETTSYAIPLGRSKD